MSDEVSKAPARIWADTKLQETVAGSRIGTHWDRKGGFAKVEYVRADIADTLRARVAELEAALGPVAKEADAWESYADNERIVEGFPEYYGELTVGDLRTARAALKE